MSNQIQSALTQALPVESASRELIEQLGEIDARVLFFFCSHRHDGAELSRRLRVRYPRAEVVGCTTAGEFVQDHGGENGVSALALGPGKVRAAHVAAARLGSTPEAAVRAAAERLAGSVGAPLRELDASRHAGVLLIDGLGMHEERVNEELGRVAPLLSFVGGSAGDNLEFRETRLFWNGESLGDAALLVLLEMAVPFTVAKTCSFTPTEHTFTITRADPATRTVYEVDGEPVTLAYARALGVQPEELSAGVFMRHPVGILVDDEPWIRSPQQVLPDGGLRFYCQILEGMEVHVMRPTDLTGETQAALARARDALGGTPGGALLFNCILRRLELDATDGHDQFHAAFRGFPAAGFHTYGESWLGHINQTCTGLVFA